MGGADSGTSAAEDRLHEIVADPVIDLAMPREFDPDDVLSRPLMANLATVVADGAPRNAPVWFIWEEAAIWLLGSSDGSAVKHLERDPRCAVEIVPLRQRCRHPAASGTARRRQHRTDVARPLQTARPANISVAEAGWNQWFIDNVAQIDIRKAA